MDEGLKKRLVGATVLVSLVVIFVPMLLSNNGDREPGIEISNIPPRPDRSFTHEVLPDEDQSLSTPPTIVRLQPPQREQSPPPATSRYQMEPLPAAETPVMTRIKPQSHPGPKPKARPKPTPKPEPRERKEPVTTPHAKVKERGGGTPRQASLSSWVIQVGSFSSRGNADKLVKRLREKSFSAFVAQASVKGKQVYRVRVGPEVDRGLAEKTLTRLNQAMKSQGVRGSIRRYP